MNLHRAITTIFLSQVVQAHISHPAADSANSPLNHEELIEDEAAVAKQVEDDQASAASAQARVRIAAPWKGVSAETIDVGVIVSSSAARRDRRRQMKDGKRTSSMVSQKDTKNRRLQATYCDDAATALSPDSTISFDIEVYYDASFINRRIEAPRGCIEFSACHDFENSNRTYPYLAMYLYERVDDDNDHDNCKSFGYFSFYGVDCRSAISKVIVMELEVATTLTLGLFGFGDFELTTSKCKSSKSAK